MVKSGRSRLIHAHFFFVDVVGLSDPTMPTDIQVKKLTFLYKSIAECEAYWSRPKNTMLVLPTGDGVAIGFLQGPELPLQLSLQLHHKIRRYNEGRVPSESIYVRIGIHSGPVFLVKDLKGNNNIWGPGIILARRIMDLGEDDHILVSSQVAKMLLPLSGEYGSYLHELGPHILKHNLQLIVYSAYLDTGKKTFGNPSWPKKLEPLTPMLLYPYIGVDIRIMNPDTMLVHYKRGYEIQNATEEPVRTVSHQIATDVSKSWDELNIRVVDDEGRELVVSEIEVNKPKQKKFDTTFIKPLMFGDKRRYVLEYDVEEPHRIFENIFLVRCGKFVVRIDYPINGKINAPIVYEVDRLKDTKRKCLIQPTIRQKRRNRCVAEWSVDDCAPQKSFRFEW